jgi:hypothetical protein
LTTTFESESSLVTAAGSTNVGTSVLNFVTVLGPASPGGSYRAPFLRLPSIESPVDVMSLTFPAFTWSTKNG